MARETLDMALDEVIEAGGGGRGSGRRAKPAVGERTEQAQESSSKADEAAAMAKLDMSLDEVIQKEVHGKPKGTKGRGRGSGKGKGWNGEETKESNEKSSWGSGGSGGSNWNKGTSGSSSTWNRGGDSSSWNDKRNGSSNWGSGGGHGGRKEANSSWDRNGGGNSSWNDKSRATASSNKSADWDDSWSKSWSGGSAGGRRKGGDDDWEGEWNWSGNQWDQENSRAGRDRNWKESQQQESWERPAARAERGPPVGAGGYAQAQKRKREEAPDTAAADRRVKRVKVKNIPRDLEAQDIKEAFEAEAGKVARCELERGTAWITFVRHEDAKKAVQTFDRGELNGNIIAVQLDS